MIETRPDVSTLVEAEGSDGPVALTLLAPALTGGRGPRRAVLRLARLRGSIQHPHLLAFQGAIESGNRVYLVSALPGRRTLAHLLGEGPLEAGEVLPILGQVAGALGTAAARGLTHRDLTPRAVVIQEEGETQRAFLTDFGIAVPSSRGCGALVLGDAVDYRSPEELRGNPPKPQSNVYSLACILVRCLTGTAPHSHDRPLLTLHAHLVEPPPRVSDRRPDLPPELDAVVARGMAKDPRERYPSAGHLVLAAGHALGIQVPVLVRKPGQEERRRRYEAPPLVAIGRRARRTTAWVALALLASVVSGFATSGLDLSASPRPRPVVEPPAPREQLDHVAYTQDLSRAVRRLRARRVAGRTRLHDARRPLGQSAAAGALASAYRHARAAVPPASSTSASGRPPLDKELREAERAYRRLAAAARGRNRRDWRVARREAQRHEAALQRELRRARVGELEFKGG